MTKGKYYHNPNVIENAFIGGILKNQFFFVKGKSKWHIAKKNH
jgi:hypothetical protein